jgi:biopolymer transport protein ExbB
MRTISGRVRALLPLLFGAASCWAADEARSGARLDTLADVIGAGGWTMYVLVGLSAVGLFLVFFFLLTLRAEVLFPWKLQRRLLEAAHEGDLDALRTLCAEQDCALTRILHAAIEQFALDPRARYEALGGAMEDEGSRQAALLWQRIQYLLDIAVVAPMVGLLGTVLGMLQSFAGLQAELGAVIPTALAAGVAKALITTAAGLLVGIPAMLLYAGFRGRVTGLIAGLEGAAGRILRQLSVTLERRNGGGA